MSYSCFISFKQMEQEEIYPFLQKIKAVAIEKMDQIAKDEFHYCPFCRNELYLPDNYMDISKEKKKEARSWAINCVFMNRYFYNKEQKLFGMYGVTNALTGLFDLTVHFQNSCDQNYNRGDWEGVKLFEDIYDAWMNYPKEYVKNKLGNEWDEECDNNEEKWELYHRQSFCYDEIWSFFEHTLYNHEETLYFGVFGPQELQETGRFIVQCYKNYKEWEKEFEEE